MNLHIKSIIKCKKLFIIQFQVSTMTFILFHNFYYSYYFAYYIYNFNADLPYSMNELILCYVSDLNLAFLCLFFLASLPRFHSLSFRIYLNYHLNVLLKGMHPSFPSYYSLSPRIFLPPYHMKYILTVSLLIRHPFNSILLQK